MSPVESFTCPARTARTAHRIESHGPISDGLESFWTQRCMISPVSLDVAHEVVHEAA